VVCTTKPVCAHMRAVLSATASTPLPLIQLDLQAYGSISILSDSGSGCSTAPSGTFHPIDVTMPIHKVIAEQAAMPQPSHVLSMQARCRSSVPHGTSALATLHPTLHATSTKQQHSLVD
jgi:hypothetical protein